MFIEENENGLIYMRSTMIGAKHAFTTRFGGVSVGPFASLNLASEKGDDPEAVRENFRRVCALFGTDEKRRVYGQTGTSKSGARRDLGG